MHPRRKKLFYNNNLDKIFTWVDASYAVHHDMKSQDGGVMSVVLGVTPCRSSKKKLNMKNLTEAGLISASDCVTYNI